MNFIQKVIHDSRGLLINGMTCSDLFPRAVNLPAICMVDQSLDQKTFYEVVAIVQTRDEEAMVFL